MNALEHPLSLCIICLFQSAAIHTNLRAANLAASEHLAMSCVQSSSKLHTNFSSQICKALIRKINFFFAACSLTFCIIDTQTILWRSSKRFARFQIKANGQTNDQMVMGFSWPLAHVLATCLPAASGEIRLRDRTHSVQDSPCTRSKCSLDGQGWTQRCSE